jgi:hypothetical protein
VDDAARQVSYGVKSFWTQKVRYFDDAGKKRMAHRRLDNGLHVGWLARCGQFPLVDFNFPARDPPIWEPEIQGGAQAQPRHKRSGTVRPPLDAQLADQ